MSVGRPSIARENYGEIFRRRNPFFRYESVCTSRSAFVDYPRYVSGRYEDRKIFVPETFRDTKFVWTRFDRFVRCKSTFAKFENFDR